MEKFKGNNGEDENIIDFETFRKEKKINEAKRRDDEMFPAEWVEPDNPERRAEIESYALFLSRFRETVVGKLITKNRAEIDDSGTDYLNFYTNTESKSMHDIKAELEEVSKEDFENNKIFYCALFDNFVDRFKTMEME